MFPPTEIHGENQVVHLRTGAEESGEATSTNNKSGAGGTMIGKKIKANREDTVGIVKIKKSKKTTKIPGFFNKKYLKKALKYLDTFTTQDVSISFIVNKESKCACLLYYPDEKNKIAVACVGKTRREL